MRLRTSAATAAVTAALLVPGVAATASVPTATGAATAAAAPASVRAPAGMTTRLNAGARSQYLGSGFSGVVIDEATGRTLWSQRTATTRMPASTQKVMTAFTVLRSTSPNTQLVTRVYQSPAVAGNVYLRGAGDPSLTSAKLKTLSVRTAVQLKAQRRTTVTLYADASVFPAPTNATGWKSSYVSGGEVQPIRGLTLAGYRGANGSTAAAKTFAAHLKTAGITAKVAGAGVAPPQSRELGASWSPTMSALVGRMLSVSDNDYAEYLLRIATLESGVRPTWTSSLAHQRSVLTKAGIPLKGYVNKDGSGLSRSNRMPVNTLVSTVDHLWDDPTMRQVAFAYGAMPRAGQTGTLRTRFKSAAQRCATGKVMAKTGTLGDAVALAGVVRGSDGRTRAFAFIQNGNTKTSSVRNSIDTLATATVGCR